MAGALKVRNKGRFIVVNPPVSALQSWPASTADYMRLTAFEFRSHDEFSQAITIFHDKQSSLYRAPFDIMPRHTVFVPDEAADIWENRLAQQGFRPGLHYDRSSVIESDELDSPTIAKLRKEQYCP